MFGVKLLLCAQSMFKILEGYKGGVGVGIRAYGKWWLREIVVNIGMEGACRFV